MPATIGRDSEHEAVERLLDGASTQLTALVLEGEAGIGKTTVWRDAVRQAGIPPTRVRHKRRRGTRSMRVQVSVQNTVLRWSAVRYGRMFWLSRKTFSGS